MSPEPTGWLLAVDVGLRTGLALFSEDGRLLWCRTRHLSNRTRLRRAIRGLLTQLPDLRWVILEGGGPLAELWHREARRRGLGVWTTQAEVWRRDLLLPREQRTGAGAKRSALSLAERIVRASAAPRATPLRPDAAEAVLLGRWAWERIARDPHGTDDLAEAHRIGSS